MRKDTEKQKYRVISGPAGMGPSHRITFSEGALLGKGLIHHEDQLRGPQLTWVIDPLPTVPRGHVLVKKGRV